MEERLLIPEAQVVGVEYDDGTLQNAVMLPPIGGQVGLFAFMEGKRRIVIKQRLQMAEVVAQQLGCPCCELPNEYDIFDWDSGERILFVQEESGMCERMCCQPHHSARFAFQDVRYGVPPNTVAMRAMKPFKCCCCACCNICQHEISMTTPDGQVVSTAKQPFLAGGLTPKLEVMTRDKDMLMHEITGPTCCLGGLVELCHTITFDVSRDQHKIGMIRKLRPTSAKGALKEAVGLQDVFVLEIPEGSSLEEGASLIASTLLLDYLFFEGNPPLQCDPLDRSCSVNICNAFCCGCLCPCMCKCGGKESATNP